MTKEIRSISMSNLNRKSASIQIPNPVNIFPVNTRFTDFNNKVYKALYKFVYSSQPGLLISSTLSTIDILMSLLTFLGVSLYKTRNSNIVLFYLSIFYNIIVLFSQIIFLTLTISSYFSIKVFNYKWVPVPFIVYINFSIIGIWANIILHTLKPTVISEALVSYSVQSAFVSKKHRNTKILSTVFLLLTLLATVALLFLISQSLDYFGVQNHNTFTSSTILSCGLLCNLLRWYVTVVNCVSILGTVFVFSLLCYNVSRECKKLSNDVAKCPGTEGIDHYVYRFQSIERSAANLQSHFSNFMFTVVLLTFVGVMFTLRSSSYEYVRKWEFGASILISHTVICLVAAISFIFSAVGLNSKFAQFRLDSNNISDVQQLYSSDQTSTIKLLTLILRFKDARPPIHFGLLFPLTAQHLLLSTIVLGFGGFLVYSVDHGCIHIF